MQESCNSIANALELHLFLHEPIDIVQSISIATQSMATWYCKQHCYDTIRFRSHFELMKDTSYLALIVKLSGIHRYFLDNYHMCLKCSNLTTSMYIRIPFQMIHEDVRFRSGTIHALLNHCFLWSLQCCPPVWLGQKIWAIWTIKDKFSKLVIFVIWTIKIDLESLFQFPPFWRLIN